ncbi:hypothetical protein JCM10207_004192 [Rhodosporidiobolus poonsookiae]
MYPGFPPSRPSSQARELLSEAVTLVVGARRTVLVSSVQWCRATRRDRFLVRPFFLMLHFLLHGIHHYIPMDRMRLVMPPLLFFVLQAPFTRLAHVLFPNWMANGIITGSSVFYVLYGVMHCALHYTKLPESWHMEYHYKEPSLGFGVTLPVWDRVFSTTFVSPGQVQAAQAASGKR